MIGFCDVMVILAPKAWSYLHQTFFLCLLAHYDGDGGGDTVASVGGSNMWGTKVSTNLYDPTVMILMMVFRLFFSASKYLGNSDDDGEDNSDEDKPITFIHLVAPPTRASMKW